MIIKIMKKNGRYITMGRVSEANPKRTPEIKADKVVLLLMNENIDSKNKRVKIASVSTLLLTAINDI